MQPKAPETLPPKKSQKQSLASASQTFLFELEEPESRIHELETKPCHLENGFIRREIGLLLWIR